MNSGRAAVLGASDEDCTGKARVFRFDQELELGDLAPGDVSEHCSIWAEFWTGKDTE